MWERGQQSIPTAFLSIPRKITCPSHSSWTLDTLQSLDKPPEKPRDLRRWCPSGKKGLLYGRAQRILAATWHIESWTGYTTCLKNWTQKLHYKEGTVESWQTFFQSWILWQLWSAMDMEINSALANLWIMPFFCRSMSRKKVDLPGLPCRLHETL